MIDFEGFFLNDNDQSFKILYRSQFNGISIARLSTFAHHLYN